MSIEIKVPVLPESVSDATIATWHKQPGEPVEQDENLVDIETDKVVLEVVAPEAGTLDSIIHQEGATVTAQEIIAVFTPGEVKADSKPSQTKESETAPKSQKVEETSNSTSTGTVTNDESPAVRRLLNEHGINAANVRGTGKDGRITKNDVESFIKNGGNVQTPAVTSSIAVNLNSRESKRVPMTRLRARIAERLLSAQQDAAILTTFNEIDMKPLMDLRKKYKDAFEKKYGTRLGFMSFFVLAVVEALKNYPAVNASIDGSDIVYHGFFDIGIAVSSPRGLVVPILRDVDKLSMDEVESKIRDFGVRASNGQLSIDEMTGGTFTISNGGVFGSLMSTPILNPPQSGILGMHKIEERAVVVNGEITIRPMMYVALSYDHRIIDGKESVSFLVKVKEMLEDPTRLVMHI